MIPTLDIVAKLWQLCHVLRDDGITYHQYVTELTWLLFLKMAEETGTEVTDRGLVNLPEGYRWKDLKAKNGEAQLQFYKELLVHLGGGGSARVKAIFVNAQTSLSKPKNLKSLVDAIDEIDWYSAKQEGLGDLYEGLLAKNADEKKSGAGQYFTPRPLIDSMVALIQPKPGEHVQDPAAGTGGFLIAADRWVKKHSNNLMALSEDDQHFQIKLAFYGVELVADAHRLGLMNLMLHDIEGELICADTLSDEGAKLRKADVILSNPPFGTKKGGGLPSRTDFTYPSSNKQLCFLQHIYRNLELGGRAAVVLPDNVLFADGDGVSIRRDLMDKCDLHTILRLPTGIFYAGGVKTNVLFFTRGKTDTGNTQAVWVYDLRSNMPSFGKTTPLTRKHFEDFEKAYGPDPLGKSPRTEEGEQGRWRKFSREQITARGDNLDITWLRDETHGEDLPDPDDIAVEIRDNLRTALDEIEALMGLLEGETAE
jgi:type I restriction enzyme M protein